MQELLKIYIFTWNINGSVADEKFKHFDKCCSGSYFFTYALIMTVFAVPCSPVSKTACNRYLNHITSIKTYSGSFSLNWMCEEIYKIDLQWVLYCLCTLLDRPVKLVGEEAI